MSDTPYETIHSGIAVLAEDEPTWSDGPFPVRGVALPEDIVTNGDNTEDVATYWPPDVVQDAASLFDGAKIADGSEHTAEEVLENPQPSPETIVGEITQAQYRPGVGTLYEGEVDDPELAKRIDRRRVEVSPSLFRSLDGEHEQLDARIVEEVMAVRDLSIVAEGAAAGNSIEPASAAMTALSAEVLSEAFADDEFDTPPIDPAKKEANASSQWRAHIGSGDDLTGATPSGRTSAERTYTAEITENDD